MNKNTVYPQYRKYPHGRTYFKIISPDAWEEIHVLGSKLSLHQFKAAILPDRNYIYDLTFDYESNWIKIEADEYESLKRKAIPE
jgi:hypothetical protein